MKKFFILTYLFICSIFSIFAQQYVFDTAELLSESEIENLNTKLSQISDIHKIGIYVVTIQDYEEYGYSIEEAAESIYEQNNFGIGEQNQGLMLLLSMKDRSFDLDSFNNGKIFTSSKKERIQEAFLDDFKENSWYSGFNDFASETDSIITAYEIRVANGEMDEESIMCLTIGIIVILVISLIISFARLSSEKGKLNNIKLADEANAYESEKGVNFTVSKDIFTHSTTRTIHHESSSSSSGGGGHSHSSGHF